MSGVMQRWGAKGELYPEDKRQTVRPSGGECLSATGQKVAKKRARIRSEREVGPHWGKLDCHQKVIGNHDPL